MKKKYKKRTKRFTIEEKKSLRELHHYELVKPKYVKCKINITKDLVLHFINECKEQRAKKEIFNKNHICSEQYLKI